MYLAITMHSDLCVYWASATFFSSLHLFRSVVSTMHRRRRWAVDVLVFFLFFIGINLSTSRHKRKILCWSLNRWSLCVFFLVFFLWFDFVYEANQWMYIKIIVKIIIYCLNCTFTPHRFVYCGLACDFAFFSNSALYIVGPGHWVRCDDQMRFKWNRKKQQQI